MSLHHLNSIYLRQHIGSGSFCCRLLQRDGKDGHGMKKSTLIQIKCFRTNHTQFKIFSIQMKLFSLDSLLRGGGGGSNLYTAWPGSSEESGSFYRITLKRLILEHVL